MADLGSLNFSIHLKDCTEQDYEKIKKKLVEKQVKLNTKLGVKVDRQIIRESIDNALKSKVFKANVEVNKINVPSEVKAKLKIDDASLRDSISSAVNKKKYKINIVVDKAKVSDAVKQALQKAGYKYNTTASDVRQQRILDIQAKMAERAALAEQKLANARMQAARASSTHNTAIKRENTAMSSQSRIAGELKNQIANVYSIYTVERFVRGLYTIGGEFQKQRIALTSILGDSMKAETIFNRIKDLAVVSPFQFKELASYTKQLSAYSIPYEELYDTTKRLADISAGVGVDMGRIILAYGQVRSAAFLRGQELRQFTEAGIPLVDELAKRFTKLTGVVTSAGDVFDKISRKEVSFGMVKDVLWDLTNEGGKFYNMQEALAESLAGKWSNLQDAWDVMMADIAESNSGVLSDSLELLTDLMKHWEAVAAILGILVGVYGSYKTAVIAVNVVEKANLKIEAIQSIVNRARAIKGLTSATKAQTVAQWALNAAMKANPWMIAITAIGTLVSLYMALGDKTKSLSEKTRELNIEFEKNIENIKEQENKAKGYISKIFDKTNGIDEQRRAYINLQKIYPSVFDNMKFEQFLLEGEYQAIQKVISASKEREKIKSAGVVIEATNNRNEAKRQLDALKMQRQQVATLPGGSAKLGDIDKRIKSQTEILEQAQKALNDALKTYETYTSTKGGQQGKEPAWFKKATELYEKFDIERLKPDSEGGFQKYIENIVGANEDASSTLNEWTKKEGEWNEETRKSIDKAKQLKSATDEILKTFGRVTKETKSAAKDPIAEQWKDRADLISKALSLYDKWKKIEGEEAASQRVKGVSEFAPIFDKNGINLDLSDPSKAYQYIQDQLDQSKGKQMELYLSLGVKKENINYDNVKKGVDDSLKEIEKYISESGKKWDLYKTLFEATGNKESSMKIAFSDNVHWDDAAIDMRRKLEASMKEAGIEANIDFTETENEAKKIFGSENSALYKLWSETKDRIEKNGIDLKINAANAIKEVQSISDKIKSIENQRDEELSKYSVGSIEYDAIAEKWNNQILELKDSLLEISPAFQKLFVDTTGMSINQIDKLRREAQQLINLINASKSPVLDSNGSVKGYKYTDSNGKEAYISKENYDEVIKRLEKLGKKAGEVKMAFQRMWDWITGKNQGDGTKLKFEDIAKDLSLIAEEASNTAGQLGSMFDALGNESLGDSFSFAGDMLGSISSIASGIGSGNPFTVISGIAGGISSIAAMHDKKLDRAIERSKQRVEELQSAYDKLDDSIERSLGGDESIQRAISLYEQLEEQAKRAGSSLTESYRMQFEALKDGGINYIEELRKRIYKDLSSPFRAMTHRFDIQVNTEALQALEKVGAGKELDNSTLKQYQAQYIGLVSQRAEIEGQLRDEEDKKKSDSGKIQDYKDQLAELNEQIAYFVEDLTKELYGIDFQDWAGQISNALVEAFANGEDAAKAFDNVVNNIMKSVANNILKNMVIQPMFEKLQDKLFGENGLFKEFTDIQDNGVIAAEAIKNFFDNEGKAMIEASQSFLEAFDKATGGAITSTGDSSNSGMSKPGIQASEETMNLTNSYLNGIRLDVSVKRALLEKIGNDILPKYNVLAEAQLTQLRAIADNTLRSAKNTEANVAVLQEVRDMFNMVINKGERKIRI
ncbi:tape measure protein [Bacteroides sp.]|uniref:tape measure protein n=1 Tax=Bacteroides sp. TaxID=29523 RepID=UPI00259096ED|nr:tape measure protein [Bacteroides sp.]